MESGDDRSIGTRKYGEVSERFAAEFGGVWVEEVDVEALSGLMMREVKHILKDIAWRKVREV